MVQRFLWHQGMGNTDRGLGVDGGLREQVSPKEIWGHQGTGIT